MQLLVRGRLPGSGRRVKGFLDTESLTCVLDVPTGIKIPLSPFRMDIMVDNPTMITFGGRPHRASILVRPDHGRFALMGEFKVGIGGGYDFPLDGIYRYTGFRPTHTLKAVGVHSDGMDKWYRMSGLHWKPGNTFQPSPPVVVSNVGELQLLGRVSLTSRYAREASYEVNIRLDTPMDALGDAPLRYVQTIQDVVACAIQEFPGQPMIWRGSKHQGLHRHWLDSTPGYKHSFLDDFQIPLWHWDEILKVIKVVMENRLYRELLRIAATDIYRPAAFGDERILRKINALYTIARLRGWQPNAKRGNVGLNLPEWVKAASEKYEILRRGHWVDLVRCVRNVIAHPVPFNIRALPDLWAFEAMLDFLILDAMPLSSTQKGNWLDPHNGSIGSRLLELLRQYPTYKDRLEYEEVF